MAYHFDELPLKSTPFGRLLYEMGQTLVRTHGVRLDTLVWDADEVLWDWVMPGGELALSVGKAVVGNFGHTEWIAPRPGMRELLWGMRHASLELGLDPDVRIWTSGYAWRIWEIFHKAGGFRELLGDGPTESHPSSHPRLLTRLDYVEGLEALFAKPQWESVLEARSEQARLAICQTFKRKPKDSGFKLPELAWFLGAKAFAKSAVLIDDSHSNIQAFHASERSAIHVRSVRPKAFGFIPFTAWRPEALLRSLTSPVALAVAHALIRVQAHTQPHVEEAWMRPVTPAERTSESPEIPEVFRIQIPNAILWEQWISPLKRVKVPNA